MRLPGLDAVIWIFLGVSSLSLESASDNPVASDEENDGRQGKYLSETWHAVHTIPEGASGWIPRDPPNHSVLVTTKRRRLVKKKRRPPITTYLDQNAENMQLDVTRYPVTGSSVKSSWDELMDDQSLKPYTSRKRVTPPDQDTILKAGPNYNPVGATIHFGSEESDEYRQQINKQDRVDVIDLQPTTTTKKPIIKEILKQSGGLSLSEILQKKNITLAELLMGKKEAIKALAESRERFSTTTQTSRASDSTTITYRRIPPSTALKKDIVDRKPEAFDSITSKEIVEAQKKRLTLLQGRKPLQGGKLHDVKRIEVIMEPTTVRVDDEDHEEFITEPYNLQSTERALPSTELPIKKPSKGLPITSAKILKMVTKKPTTTSTMETTIVEEENYPKIALQPIKIDPKEAIGYPGDKKTSSGPLHITIDLENIGTTTTTTESYKELTTTSQETPQSNTSAKEEILQILKDPRGRIGLSRILEARNMTIQELIEQRERGSSQLHLADIFHNNTKEPEPSEEPLEGKISSEEFPNFPVFIRQPKELQLKEENSSKPAESSGALELPRFKIPSTVSEEVAQAENFPWQKLYPELFSEPPRNKDLSKNPVKQPIDSFNDEDLKVLEEIDQTLYSSASNEETPIVDETPRKIINISSGVKSAIYASLAIILLSMVVFVSILVVFRWMQRRKKKHNYKENLKPALMQIKCGNLKSFVSETLQRKKSNYYKRHLQSMSDDSWERASSRKNAF